VLIELHTNFEGLPSNEKVDSFSDFFAFFFWFSSFFQSHIDLDSSSFFFKHNFCYLSFLSILSIILISMYFFYLSFSIILFRILLVCSRITFYKLNKTINFVTEDSCSFSPLTSLERCIIVPFVFFWAQTYEEKVATSLNNHDGFLLQSLWQTRCKRGIWVTNPCKGNVYLPWRLNLIWFWGPKLHIHWLESELSINLKLSTPNKIFLSLLSQCWYKHATRITDPCRRGDS
jgi:hypothetical protein